MIIDVHGHVGWLGERETNPAHLGAYLDACRVERLFVSNLNAAGSFGGGNVEETPANVECLTLCQDDPRLAPLYWVRLGQPDSHLHAFAGALEIEPFAGAIFAPTQNGFAAGDERLDPYMSVLAKLRKPALFLTSPQEAGRPAEVHELAKRHAGVPVVLCGAGGQAQWGEAVEVVGRAAERTDARLYLCTGRADAECVRAATDAIGTERLLFGSDAPFLKDRHAEHFNTMLAELHEALSPAAYAELTSENALRVFQI